MKSSTFALKKIASTPENASAINATGAYAKAASPADDTCASYSYGWLQNSCTTAKGFILPLTFSSEGWKNISFVGYGATSSNDVACKAAGFNGTLTLGYQTGTVSLPAYGSVQTVSLGSLYVYNPGTYYLYCTIQPSGKLVMASWDE
jgi:hypothetical protein